MAITRNVPGLPFTLKSSAGEAWTTDEATATLSGTAAAHSDICIDPGLRVHLRRWRTALADR